MKHKFVDDGYPEANDYDNNYVKHDDILFFDEVRKEEREAERASRLHRRCMASRMADKLRGIRKR